MPRGKGYPAMNNTPSEEYITFICTLYGDIYDDRKEDSKPRGRDWLPGVVSEHKSLKSFQQELSDKGIQLSRTKIQKILISGGCWSTERSRKVQVLYERARSAGMTSKEAIKKVAIDIRISTVAVNINLPYEKVVYNLPEKSRNAERIEKCRKGK